VGVGNPTTGVTRLAPPRPSPSRGPASLHYTIAAGEAGAVSVRVYDVTGRVVRTLFEGERGPGQYEARWDGSDEAGAVAKSGIYFARLEARGRRLTQRIVTVR
jgi:flagellar hook assembly protein FlgD